MPPLSIASSQGANKKEKKKLKKRPKLARQQLEPDITQPGPVNAKLPSVIAIPPAQRSGGSISNTGIVPCISRCSLPLPSDPGERQRRIERELRFANAPHTERKARETLVDARRRQSTAEGTSCQLEKQYLRLTSAPDRASVRPPAVLEQALQTLKDRWLQGVSYVYASDQLKAMRQDLLIQNVREMLTVEVYETHARIAIEVSDWAEFNQCQSRLKQLYLEQDPEEGPSVAISASEFAAYRLLHSCSISSRAYQAELLDQSKSSLLEHDFTRHALNVCRAYLSGAYSSFVSFYEDAPRMCPYLMDVLATKLQQRGLSAMVKAYFPTVPIEFVMLQLGVNSPKEMEELRRQTDSVLRDGLLDTKASRLAQASHGDLCE